MTTDHAFMSAPALAAAIRAKEISSVELLELYLDRIARLNPGINAVVTIDEDAARTRAQEADAALVRGESWGPLHGVPMTLKETFQTAGMRTTAGLEEFAAFVPEVDADVTARLRAAGAVIFGKTNVPEGAIDYQCFNPVFGVTNNPWNEDRTSGGSSGGAAAALAAGFTALEVGSDLGGSIRTPSHSCGVYGLKPTFGIISVHGHLPPPPGALMEMDNVVVGPMGRSPDDLDLGLDVLAGPDAVRGVAWKLELPPPRATALKDFRVGAWLDDSDCPVDAPMLEVMEHAVEALRGAGVSVDDTSRPVGLAESINLYLSVMLGGFGRMVPDEPYAEMIRIAEERAGEDTGEIRFWPGPSEEEIDLVSARVYTMRVREWHGYEEQRQQVRARWAEYFEDHDVLLCPVTRTEAIPHDLTPSMSDRTVLINGEQCNYHESHMTWTGLTLMPYLPAVVAPIGRTRSGLPVGIQIVAPYLEDRTAIEFARRLADVVGGFEAPPGYR